MKLLKTFSLIVAFGLSISLTTHAQTRVDRWSGNAAFMTGVQPDFDITTQSTVYTDADVNDGTNNSVDHTGALLRIGPMVNGNGNGRINDGYLYTSFTSPSMEIASSGILEGIGYLTLSITSAGTKQYTGGEITLDSDGEFGPAHFTSIEAGAVGENTLYRAVWTWEVTSSELNEFTLSWLTPAVAPYPGAHAYYMDITLTQSVEAIPEPSTWALLGAGLFAAVWMSRRRKASLSVGQ
ncbi:MAG TPA: PEP-CTERM sorting domain-containing protein [Chthoniobacteraceae bacterium]|nr:PEP-CTERM sorting domain-containing protein [Chthoniobacteraceae bacterium]